MEMENCIPTNSCPLTKASKFKIYMTYGLFVIEFERIKSIFNIQKASLFEEKSIRLIKKN